MSVLRRRGLDNLVQAQVGHGQECPCYAGVAWTVLSKHKLGTDRKVRATQAWLGQSCPSIPTRFLAFGSE
jgi:hypothetical protein